MRLHGRVAFLSGAPHDGLASANRGLDIVQVELPEQVHRRSQDVVAEALEEDPAFFGQLHSVVPGDQPIGGQLGQQCVGGVAVQTR